MAAPESAPASRTQSINLTDKRDLLSESTPDFTFTRDSGYAKVAPGTAPDEWPEMSQVVAEARSRGKTDDDTGLVDLRGLRGGGKNGEYWVVRDQYTAHDETTKNIGPEPIPDTVIRLRGKGWKVLKNMVGMDTVNPATGKVKKREEIVEDVDDIVVDSDERIHQISRKRVKSAWTRPLKTYASNNRKGGIYMEPIIGRNGKQKKALIPRPYSQKNHDGYGPALLRGEPETVTIVTDTPMLGIDIYTEDGKLKQQQEWTRENLARYLHDPKNPTELRFTPAGEKAPCELAYTEREHFGINLENTHDPYTVIVNRLKAEGLPDSLVGITWDRGGNRYQIVQDVLNREQVRDRAYAREESVRTFVVRKYDAAGNIVGHKLYRDAELQDYFKDSVSPTKKKKLQTLKKKHFTPLDYVYRYSAKHETKEAEAPPHFSPWQRVLALRLMDDLDINPGKPLTEVLTKVRDDPQEALYFNQLCMVAGNIGTKKVKEYVTEARNSYLKAIDLLELTVPPNDKDKVRMRTERVSTQWVLNELLEQHYYADHPDEASPADMEKYGLDLSTRTNQFQSYISDPFEDSTTGLQARRRLLQRSVAAEYLRFALEIKQAPKQQKNPQTGEPLFKAGTKEPLVDIIQIYQEDEEVTKKLLDIVADRAKTILDKLVNKEVDKVELSMNDKVELGDLLLQQFPDSALKK